jgi:glucose-6-phosphate isomerase
MAKDDEFWKNEGIYYALGRFALIGQGKVLEAYEFYEPRLRNIGEWLKQLFAESEGKEGKGIFPASMIFSTDLHSIGQFLQEGNPVFFETVIDVDKWDEDVTVPDWIGNALGGMSLNAVNKTAVDGVIAAHAAAGTPIFRINIDDCKEYSLGQFLYFCMLSTAVTGKLMKIDPFNQPGVEQYKIEVKSRLGI